MTFCLNSIIIKPENGSEIKNAIILLHGYGGDGKDISMLSLNWKRHMPNIRTTPTAIKRAIDRTLTIIPDNIFVL